MLISDMSGEQKPLLLLKLSHCAEQVLLCYSRCSSVYINSEMQNAVKCFFRQELY